MTRVRWTLAGCLDRLGICTTLPLATAALACAAIGCVSETSDTMGGNAIEPGLCGRGLLVLQSDYMLTNVSLVGFDGTVFSPSFVSSASIAPGAGSPLSGDVVAPTMPQPGERVALIDRYPAGVLTWVDTKSGEERGQLEVNTGFGANLQDYVELTASKAYISRLQPNPVPGDEPFDEGSDIVIVDPLAPAVTGRIDLKAAMSGEDSKYYPRPNRIVVTEGRAIVLLSAYALNFIDSAPSRLVVIDTASDALLSTTVLDGMHGCTGLALSPGGKEVAVTCSGTFSSDTSSSLGEAGLVWLSRDGDTLTEARRFMASDLGQGPLGFSVSFADEATVIFTTFGHDAAEGTEAVDDTLVELHLESGEHRVLLRSSQEPFTFGEVRCAAACGVCFLTDAGTDGGVMHRFTVEGGALTLDRAIRVEREIGFPPRYIGQF